MQFNRSSGLYVIVDLDALRGADPLRFAQVVLRAAPLFALQLRAKHSTDAQTLALAKDLRALCGDAKVSFVLNDRPDLAVMAGADAVHVGQDDLPLERVRELAPGCSVGHSTHNLAQLEQSLALSPDYVAIGPVFSTQSKENPDPVVGISQLALAAKRCAAANVPLVAIGGISLENAHSIRAAGASCAAVIGDLARYALDELALETHTRALAQALSQ